jgi:hypothetical protein
MGAPESIIEQNAFYARLKFALGQKNLEVAKLKELIATQKKEFDEMKVRYETVAETHRQVKPVIRRNHIAFRVSHRMTIEKFAAEYSSMMSASGSTMQPLISMKPVNPLPTLEKEEDHRVKCWTKDKLMDALQAMEKGHTDGHSSSIKAKAKPGRPPKKSSGEDTHFYLENSDGTPVSKTALLALSQKARGVWETLLYHKMAPRSWGRLSSTAWDFYARTMLKEPGLEFLRLCNDGQWKLKEWSQRNYSGWAGNKGLRPVGTGKKNKKKKESDTDTLADTDNDDLSNPTLI